MKVINALRLLVGTSLRVAPGTAVACLAETGGVLITLLQSWSLALLVEAASQRDVRQMIITASVFVGQIAVSRLLLGIGMNARMNQLELVAHEFSARIGQITASIPTVDHLDDPRYLDQLRILREQEGSIGLAVNTLLNQLNSLIGVVGVLALAVSADPRMLLVAAAGIPTVLAGPLVARWQRRAEAASAEPGRRAEALLRLALAPEHAGEIRVFGLGTGLRARQRAASRAWRAPIVGLSTRQSLAAAITQLIFFGVAAGVLAWLVSDALTGTVGVAEITLALLLITRLQNVSSELQGIINEVAEMTRTADRYLWLLEAVDRIDAQHPGRAAPPARAGRLRLRQVGYRYPGAGRDALTDVSLDLEPGTVLAVVGENGAGKSTLAELLAGIRTPTSGAIVVDATDLSEVDITRWRAMTSAAFQDHVRFEFRLQESVGIGDLPRRTDAAAVDAAIDRGAARQVVDSLPDGARTQLGSAWPDGTDLSGGQWQRLAIARGMMRPAPLVRLLDEPTAALDALTEHQLFDRYAEAARSGRQTGTVSILVTHRFSTVAAADLIIVLADGRLIEIGTHRQLLAADGHYAQLYRLQARGYRR